MRILPLCAWTFTLTMAHPGHDMIVQTPMSSKEFAAIKDVEYLCADEVTYACESSMFDFFTTSVITDMDALFNEMINQFFQNPVQVQRSDAAVPDFMFWKVEFPEDVVVMNSVSKVAVQTPPEEFDDVAFKLQEHGNKMLESAVSETEFRMARRLTEISPKVLHEVRTAQGMVPFHCPHRYNCLRERYEAGQLSPSCAKSIASLESVRVEQYQQQVEQLNEHRMIAIELAIIYLIVVAIMITFRVRFFKKIQAATRLKRRILQAVYSTPAIKEAVEKTLGGKAIGKSSPFLMRRKRSPLYRVLKNIGILSLCVLLFIKPLVALPMVIVSFFYVWMRMLFSGAGECSCCCCGASPSSEHLTDEQMCCNCCKGTGVCSPQCMNCCGGGGCCGGEGGCSCCGGSGCCCCGGACCGGSCSCCSGSGCCCCGGKAGKGCPNSPDKATSGCCCCSCCAKMGCSCCSSKGTAEGGCCGDKGCCCCSQDKKEPKGRCCEATKGQPTIDCRKEDQKLCVFEGVPIQIV